jgi:hypothetical protein
MITMKYLVGFLSFFANLAYKAFTIQNENRLSFHLKDEGTIQTNFIYLQTERHRSTVSSIALVLFLLAVPYLTSVMDH